MNVILIILDALRYDHVNSENTPNLMELAKKGVFFTNATSCNSSTIVSLPYILCGKKDYDSEKNIASILYNAGVHTAMIHSNPILHKFYPGFNDSIGDLVQLDTARRENGAVDAAFALQHELHRRIRRH